MTEEEFDELKSECKREWKDLAETGDVDKSPEMDKYYHRCPACHIARSVIEQYKLNIPFCNFCPITIWREEAKLIDYSIVCQHDEAGLYDLWLRAKDDEERKKIAFQIYELEWSYIEKYKLIKITEYQGELYD